VAQATEESEHARQAFKEAERWWLEAAVMCAVKKATSKEEETARAAPQCKIFFMRPFPSLASVAEHLLF
jgi:hypothetical protein